MAVFTGTLSDSIFAHGSYGATGYGGVLNDVVSARSSFGPVGFGSTLTGAVGVSAPTFFYNYLPGAILSDVAHIHETLTAQGIYSQTLAQAIRALSALSAARPVTLSEALGVSGVLTTARAIALLQRLGASSQLQLNVVQGMALHDLVKVASSIVSFFGLDAVDHIGVAGSLSVQAQFNKILVSDIGVLGTLANGALFLRVLNDGVEVDDSALINAIYTGTLADTINISLGWIDPGGGFTTWAINTRTNTVTEYQNFVFNSFAKIGNEFYGANSDGLWLLNAQTDDGANISADIKGAMLSLGGSRFTQLAQVYFGMRVDDNARDFVLKLIVPSAGTGGVDKTYVYTFAPKDMATTRLNIGKGLRARYIQWELVTPGADFSLDSIEFIPIVSRRRV